MIYQKGLSLIEMLCVLLLSMILLGSITELVFSYRHLHGLMQDFSHIQENARFINVMIDEAIKPLKFFNQKFIIKHYYHRILN